MRSLLLTTVALALSVQSCKPPSRQVAELGSALGAPQAQCDTNCQEDLADATAGFEGAGHVLIGLVKGSALDGQARSRSDTPAFVSDEELTRLRWELMGAVREFRADLTNVAPGESFRIPGEAQGRWGSPWIFDGCEGNAFQGSKDASDDSLKACADFLMNARSGMTALFLAYGRSQVVYVNASGVNLSGIANGAAVFRRKTLLPEWSFVRLKPTGGQPVVLPLPENLSEGFGAQRELVRRALLVGEPPSDIGGLSDAYRSSRIEQLRIIPNIVVSTASIAATFLTFGATAGAVANAAGTAARVWAIINLVSAGIGVGADLATLVGAEQLINRMPDERRRGQMRAALLTVNLLSMGGIVSNVRYLPKAQRAIAGSVRALVRVGCEKAALLQLGKTGAAQLSNAELNAIRGAVDETIAQANLEDALTTKTPLQLITKLIEDFKARLARWLTRLRGGQQVVEEAEDFSWAGARFIEVVGDSHVLSRAEPTLNAIRQHGRRLIQAWAQNDGSREALLTDYVANIFTDRLTRDGTRALTPETRLVFDAAVDDMAQSLRRELEQGALKEPDDLYGFLLQKIGPHKTRVSTSALNARYHPNANPSRDLADFEAYTKAYQDLRKSQSLNEFYDAVERIYRNSNPIFEAHDPRLGSGNCFNAVQSLYLRMRGHYSSPNFFYMSKDIALRQVKDLAINAQVPVGDRSDLYRFGRGLLGRAPGQEASAQAVRARLGSLSEGSMAMLISTVETRDSLGKITGFAGHATLVVKFKGILFNVNNQMPTTDGLITSVDDWLTKIWRPAPGTEARFYAVPFEGTFRD